MPSPPIIDVSDLTIRRQKTTLLDRVAWRVNRGEHWVILGANGSGKTSLLRALAGYLAPTTGEIDVLGQHYGESVWPKLREKIGIVTNSFTALIPLCETALDTVISGRYAQLDLWVRPTSADRRAALGLLRRLDAAHTAQREWQYLSQGERQRVLIARALMARPKLMILDEPCSGLDPIARRDFLATVEKLATQKRGPSLVLVTHHVEEITPTFSHALLLQSGRVAASGPKHKTLTPAKLSQIFDAPVRLRKTRTGLRLECAEAG